MFLNSDFKDLLNLLNARGAKYLIVGGYAVSAHGEPRGTKDLDIWVGFDVGNARKIIDVLKEFSGEKLDITPERLASPGSFITFGMAPNRVDILASISGCDFNQCYARGIKMAFDGVNSPVISLNDLIINKSTANPPQDKVDAAKLKRLAAKLAKKK